MKWTKAGSDGWICRVMPEGRFTLKAFPTADGRWNWQVFSGDADGPMATGIVGNLGSAKSTSEQFLRRRT